MPDWFSSRVPLNSEDARVNKERYEDAVQAGLDAESLMRAQDLRRLKLIAEGKRYAERDMRRAGPVDQEVAMRFGANIADHYGATGRSALPMAVKGLSELSAYGESQPESRNVFHQAMIIPEQAIMHASEALSGDKSLSDRAARLLMAAPAAAMPDLGYPVNQAYDRMYATNPIGAIAVDLMTPGLENAYQPTKKLMGAIRHGDGSPTYLVDQAGEVIRRLRNSPPAPRLALPVR